MSEPKKHHYLPEFYLRPWCNGNGQVFEFARPHMRLACKRRSPGGTGYQVELYSISSRKDPKLRQELESRFMSRVDTTAAEALRTILEGHVEELSAHLRDGWSRFLMSMVHRTPRRIRQLQKLITEKDAEIWDELEQRYLEFRTEEHPETFEDYWAERSSSLFDEGLAVLIQQLVDSSTVGTALNSMHWSFGRLRGHNYTYLTSDAPVVMSRGLGGSSGFLLLPIGPDTLFVASNDEGLARSFFDRKSDELASAVNDIVAARAHEIVVAADREQERFIDNRLLSSTNRPATEFFGIPIWNGADEF